jgi:hypothetical protein
MNELLINEIICELSQELENKLNTRDKLTIEIEAIKTTIQTLTSYTEYNEEDILYYTDNYYVEI